jgi:glycosyltransferase involved in cell wall biosynthesis
MIQPTVSVLIPCYNAEPYIAETLQSVFRQTWQNIEIIVVDDGSTDGSAGVVQAMARPNLKLIRQQNRGQTAALNTCLKYASGAFVQYLDADDLIDPEKIEIQMARMLEASPYCVASAEWGRFYFSPSEVVFRPEDVWQDLDPVDWLAMSRSEGLEMMFPALWLIPMQLIRKSGPWLEELTLNNDAEYFTRVLLASHRVLFCSGARCRYRSGLPNSLSHSKSKRAWLSQYRVLDLCEGYVRAREDSERVRRGFAISWQIIVQDCYPYDAQLSEECLRRARSLHTVDILPLGGKMFRFISRLLGWRLARRLQLAVKSWRYPFGKSA